MRHANISYSNGKMHSIVQNELLQVKEWIVLEIKLNNYIFQYLPAFYLCIATHSSLAAEKPFNRKESSKKSKNTQKVFCRSFYSPETCCACISEYPCFLLHFRHFCLFKSLQVEFVFIDETPKQKSLSKTMPLITC